MLRTGVTTVADLSGPDPWWVDLAAQSGLRVFLAPSFASARWHLENEWQLKYVWDDAACKQAFHNAIALIERAKKHPCNRLSGIVFPAQIDTCTEELLRDAYAAAETGGLPFTTHCAQSVNEFNEMLHRHGRTPIRWARDLGVLSPRSILGHAIFTDDHSWTCWHTKDDVRILAETGTSVAHCPSPFARYGQMLENFGRYRRAGVNMGLGTDVSPHNLIEEMRLAAILARVAARDITTTNTAEVFYAATVGGADALGRDDIGRLKVGGRADIVLVDLTNPFMLPARDPLRSLVYTAADRAVHSVFVDGCKVVDARRVLTLDHAEALGVLADSQARMMATVPQHDWAARRAEQIVPLSLPSI
jgi:cytosine/adenosine deaminase-related metal-dependent hydrolase